MPASAHQPPFTTTVLIYVVAIAIFVFRMTRPQRISVVRLWVMPVLLVVLTGFSIWGSYYSEMMRGEIPPPAWEIAVVLFAGAVLGVPLGVLRGRHSDVRPTDRAGVMFVHSSPVIIVIWLCAFLARAGLRYVLPGASTGASIWSDGLLAFAMAALITSYAAIYTKYRRLTQSPAPN
jgi:hypothetical protein